jgi:hypothetical protein
MQEFDTALHDVLLDIRRKGCAFTVNLWIQVVQNNDFVMALCEAIHDV